MATAGQEWRAKVEQLKEQWLADPCWDIETTEGFEAARDELHIFRLETELKYLRGELAKFNAFRKSLRAFIEGEP